MIPKTTMSFFAIVLVLLLAGDTMCEMSEDTVDRINNGIELGGTLLEAAKGLGESKLFKNLGNMASFLGPVGGIISFALLFAPKKDSEELQYMKKKFAEVNGKLDKITSELENVKELITYDTQRAVYVDSADKINHGHRQLLAFLDELQKTPCDNKEDCRRKRIQIGERYVEDFNVKQHLFKIVNGAIKRTSPFGEPLLQLVRKTFKCDVGKVDDLADGILALSFKAQQVILAYEKLKGSNHSITESMNSWLTAVYELREATYKIKKPCFDDISSFMITDITDKKYQVDVSSNEEANKKVKTFMEKKYKWLGWVRFITIVYYKTLPICAHVASACLQVLEGIQPRS
jgi:gas vesicle protein